MEAAAGALWMKSIASREGVPTTEGIRCGLFSFCLFRGSFCLLEAR